MGHFFFLNNIDLSVQCKIHMNYILIRCVHRKPVVFCMIYRAAMMMAYRYDRLYESTQNITCIDYLRIGRVPASLTI